MPSRNMHPRTACPVCLREVAIDTRNAQPGVIGTLSRHNDAERDGTPCSAAGDPVAEPDAPDNDSIQVSGFAGLGYGPAVAAPQDELAQWWRNLAEGEINAVVAKAVEYGATDLRDLGWQVLEMADRRRKLVDGDDSLGADAYATEVGIAFYAMGKLARIAAAIKEGRQPSYDSWHDLGVYARMAQRVHQVGAWPGIGLERERG